MILSREHILALKISILLLFIAFFVTIFFQFLNQNEIINFSWNRWSNKYYIFVSLSIIIYFVSLKLAYLTTKPIKEANEKLKNYNHNLAHELKTPLAVLRSNLDLLDISYDKILIKSSFEEIYSMENIINSLLFLAENPKNKLKDKINFNNLFEKYKENKDVLLNIKDDFIVYWDKNLFEILVKNLIENWLKYSLDKKINIEIKNGEIIFSNKIDKNIRKEELEKYFEIFYKWQNLNDFSSYWIWLSIVKKICDNYNLKILLRSENNKFLVILKRN